MLEINDLDTSRPADAKTPDALPARKEASTPVPQKLPLTLAVEDGGDIAVPDFTGKTMREVMESCIRLGLDPVPLGTGLASGQSPAGGSKVRRGAKITVQFGGAGSGKQVAIREETRDRSRNR